MSLVGDILFVVCVELDALIDQLALLAAAMVCSAGQYDGGSDDMMTVVIQASKNDKAIFMRFSCLWAMSSK